MDVAANLGASGGIRLETAGGEEEFRNVGGGEGRRGRW
jgi:hypothetical protein